MNNTQKTIYWRTPRRFQNIKFLCLSNDFHIIYASKALVDFGFDTNYINETAPIFTKYISNNNKDYFVTGILSGLNDKNKRIQLQLNITNDDNKSLRKVFCQIYKNDQSISENIGYDCFLLDMDSPNFLSELSDVAEMETEFIYKRSFDMLDIPLSISKDMNIQFANKAFAKMAGYSLNQIHCMRLSSAICDSSYSALVAHENLHYNGLNTEKTNLSIKTSEEERIKTDVFGCPIDLDGRFSSLNIFFPSDLINDNSDNYGEAIAVANRISEGVLITDKSKKNMWVNNAFIELTGYSADEIKEVELTKDNVDEKLDFNCDIMPFIEQNSEWQGVLQIKKKNGIFFTGEVFIFKIKNSYDDRYAVIIHDLSLDIEREKQILVNENSDKLTGFNIRMQFLKKLEQACTNAKEKHEELNVLVFKIDNFSSINDDAGFYLGDKMLKMISMRMINLVGDKDRISRLGGVSFALYFYGDEKKKFIEYFMDNIKLPFIFEDYDNYVTVSVGLASLSDAKSAEELYKNAYDAMEYSKKRDAVNSCTIYDNGKYINYDE